MVKIDFDNTYTRGARIKVIGVGGAGKNAVTRMMEDGIEGVEFISADTDNASLHNSEAPIKILLGEKLTKGLGTGAKPETGMNAAEEAKKEISQAIDGADMLFIVAGMGGGTGMGAAPVVAEIAKSKGILTVGVVTKPFLFEGKYRTKNALEGIKKLKDNVDTLVVIPNQKLLQIIDKDTTVIGAFKKSDEILSQAVQGVADLITKPGLIGMDFADIHAILSNKGFAYIGVGRATGKNKYKEAVMSAIKSPLIETAIGSVRSVLVSIAGDRNLDFLDTARTADLIRESLDIDAEIIYGAYINDNLEDEVTFTIICAGVELEESAESFAYPESHSESSSPEENAKIKTSKTRRKKNKKRKY